MNGRRGIGPPPFPHFCPHFALIFCPHFALIFVHKFPVFSAGFDNKNTPKFAKNTPKYVKIDSPPHDGGGRNGALVRCAVHLEAENKAKKAFKRAKKS